MSALGGAGPESPGWTPPAGATYLASQRYRRLAGLEPWIFWLLLATAAAYAASAVITVAAHGLGEFSTPARIDRLSGADAALSVLGFLQSGLFIAVAVLFIIWFYRAYENLRPLAAPEPRHSSGWTIGAWFVPILDLILPKLMLNEVWRGSEPDRARDPAEVRVPAFHHLWWWLWVLAFLLAVALAIQGGIASFDSVSSGGRGATTTSGALSASSSLLGAVAAVLGALVVRRTTERQETRWTGLTAARATG